MLHRLLAFLGLRRASSGRGLPAGLPTVERTQIAPFLVTREGLPQLDWGMANAWISRQTDEAPREAGWRRAVTATWLDEVRDALTDDHRRWRAARVEGLGPLDGNGAVIVARAADKAFDAVEKALQPLRDAIPIPPVAIVALGTQESYYSFISHFFPDEGHWGTSGGVYINDGPNSFPIIALPTNLKRSVDQTIAHELTHHALRGRELPLWIEEGITQMMEERVTGVPNFKLDREFMQRHQDHWQEEALDRFLAGEAFSSPHDDEQELAYHLSQLVVRGMLSRDPKRFFAFARSCADTEPSDAAVATLGLSQAEIVEQAIGAAR